MATVAVHNLEKSYGRVRVVHGIDFEIENREFVALIGPSGCGKSTLLRMIAGLEEISGGDIRIDDEVVNEVAPRNRDIAMVFQSYALYPHMTVEENMGFALKMAGVPEAERKERVAVAAEVLNLGTYLARFPRELSGGQRQRVAMGRAIVRRPKLFLFDEPLSNLDAKLRVRMRSEIRRLHQRLEATSIYVTHDQIEAMTMADKIVVMRDGVIEQVGAPLDLYDCPANAFVAAFIGSPSINMLDATIAREADGWQAVLGDGSRLALSDRAALSEGLRVQVGIRPEHLMPNDGPGTLGFVVDVVEPTGSETIVTGSIAAADSQMVLRDRHRFAIGTTVPVAAPAERIHLFDAESGLRL